VSGFFSLFCARALVGIGESCYGAISPSFVAEKFSEKMRSRALALFSMAIPVGSALGYAGGGLMGNFLGWRRAIWLVAIPGLFMTLLCLALPEDPKTKSSASPIQDYLQVWRIRTFRYTTYACAAMTFALGGFAVWIPTFFHRQWGMSVGYAGTLFGAITVLGGFIGSFCGGWIADRIRTTYPDSDLIVSGIGLAAGMPLAMIALMATHLFTAVGFLFVAEVLLFLNMGPLNSVIISVSQVRMRSMAFAANIFFMHLFGDAASPTLIGWGSDLFGLNRSLLVTTITLGLAGWFCFQARRSYRLDVESALITKPA
jgi:predicted MFS family arabinose efflux permease